MNDGRLQELIRNFAHATGCLAEYLEVEAGDEELHIIPDNYPIGDSSFPEFYDDVKEWEESVTDGINQII